MVGKGGRDRGRESRESESAGRGHSTSSQSILEIHVVFTTARSLLRGRRRREIRLGAVGVEGRAVEAG